MVGRIPAGLKVLAALAGLVPAILVFAFLQAGCPPTGYPVTPQCALEMIAFVAGASSVIGFLFGLGVPAPAWKWALWINLVVFLYLYVPISWLRSREPTKELFFLVAPVGLIAVSVLFAWLGAYVGSRVRLRGFVKHG